MSISTGRVACWRRGGFPAPENLCIARLPAGHPGRLLTKDELIEAVWPDVTVTNDSLVQCISQLRAAFGDNGQSLIKTVPRRGYLLDATPSRRSR